MTHTEAQRAVTAASAGPTVEFPVHFRNGGRGRRRLRAGTQSAPPPIQPGRIPRVSRLMALAIHFDKLIRMGIVRDYADLAKLGGVSRTRISQIMDLLNLAPEIQEAILDLPRTTACQDPTSERQLRQIVQEIDWGRQRDGWNRMECRGRGHAIVAARRRWHNAVQRSHDNER